MNKLFLTAITGECCMFYLHGVKPRGYNPFALLRKVVYEKFKIKLSHHHKLVLLWLRCQYANNGIKEHSLLTIALKTIK